jgi:hypothetical protein
LKEKLNDALSKKEKKKMDALLKEKDKLEM